MSNNCIAVYIEADLLGLPSGGTVFGRHVANRDLMRALLKHCGEVGCYGHRAGQADSLQEMARAIGAHPTFLPRAKPDDLKRFGTLLMLSPMIQSEVWRRARFAPEGWSIVGQCHSLAEGRILHALAGLTRAPVRPFDAIVCQSLAARGVVERLLAAEEHDLRQHLGATAFRRPRLPVIPLPVDCEGFAPDAGARSRARADLGLKPGDLALLCVGRLDRKTKADPIPLFIAAERVARQLNSPVALLLAGSASSPDEAAITARSAATFCPGVAVRIALNAAEATVRGLYQAADIFVSLSDNIQESFGLAVAQALAAGLAVVASDWNGYRDIVTNGTEGVLVPTVAAPAAFGSRTADLYHAGLLAYEDYTREAALRTAVSVDGVAAALGLLASDPGRRRTMGEAGRRRALETFSFDAVARQYIAMFDELGAVRAAAAREPSRIHAATRSPFDLFRGHPTAMLRDSMAALLLDAALLDPLAADDASGAAPFLAGAGQIVAALRSRSPLPVGEICAQHPSSKRGEIAACLLWLAKFGVVQLVDAPILPGELHAEGNVRR